ncbi:hypothetical protein J6590_099358 [Homalodisca vitripennis]|nr:hypothetical protein J6590_099358 [Homalodisca vitripennis]
MNHPVYNLEDDGTLLQLVYEDIGLNSLEADLNSDVQCDNVLFNNNIIGLDCETNPSLTTSKELDHMDVDEAKVGLTQNSNSNQPETRERLIVPNEEVEIFEAGLTHNSVDMLISPMQTLSNRTKTGSLRKENNSCTLPLREKN